MKNQKSFSQLIEQVARRNSIATVFSDFLEMSVCALSMGAKEERYLEIVRRYEKPDAYAFADAFAAMVDVMDNGGEGLHDMLGDFFMEHISHGHNGQFFTPEPICEMMARVQGDIPDGAKIQDCAVGSGRTLLAAAKINRCALFFGADVDRNCCLMCLINLCLNGLMGEVAWMNSLSNQFYGAWRIELHPVYRTPYIRQITEDECYQLLRLPVNPKKETEPLPVVVFNKVEAVQGTLF
jgi:hypothetical protein